MMPFQDYSIRKKLMAMSLGATSGALLLACTLFLSCDFLSYRTGLVKSLSMLAEIVSLNSASAVLFNDGASASHTLASLQARPGITASAIYTPNGRIFARWPQAVDTKAPWPAAPAASSGDRYAFRRSRLLVFHPMVFDKARIGTVYIASDLSNLMHQIESYVEIAISVLLLSFFVATLIAFRVGRYISNPILELARTAASVTEHNDYSVRASGGGHDEVGLLVDTFNAMVFKIQQGVAAVQGAQNELEQRIQERTLQLNEKVTQLARSNGELEQFAYVASHDLQEPLRMVASYTQLLGKRYKGKLDADADEFIAYAVGGASRMRILIEDLLSYSRLNTKGNAFAPVGTRAIVKRAIDNLDSAVRESRAVVTLGELPTVIADESQWLQLFQNLIGNAIKYRGTAAPAVHVDAREDETDWLFSVRDNGIGIDPQYAERIFVIFQRLHTMEQYPGTGIGLAICKKIVEHHGGKIWLDSQPGHGATFYFTISKTGENCHGTDSR